MNSDSKNSNETTAATGMPVRNLLVETVQLWRERLAKLVPDRLSLNFVLSTALITSIALQFVTGVLLMFYYRAATVEAHESLIMILDRVPLGWLVRSLHMWGMDLMMGLCVVIVVRKFFAGSYQGREKLVWCSVVAIGGLALGGVFTGRQLPWDQHGYWSSMIATGVVAKMPIVGGVAAKMIRGGEPISGLTLSRFYTAHVMLLPMLLMMATVGFVLSLILQREHLVETSEERLTPAPMGHLFLRGAAVAYVVLGLVLTLAILWPVAAPPKADFTKVPDFLKPEWCFLALYQVIKYIPVWMGGVAATVFMLVVFFLPWIDPAGRGIDRSRRECRRLVKTTGAVILAIIALLILLGNIAERDYTVFGKHVYFTSQGRPEVKEGK